MALLATAATLFAYLFCSLAVLRLQAQGRMDRSKALSVVAAIGAAYSIWTFYGAGWSVTFWGVVLMVAGAPVYLLVRKIARADRI
jgi:APA family basic amino acid/polyamine antiporter